MPHRHNKNYTKLIAIMAISLLSPFVFAENTENEDEYAEVRTQLQTCFACHGENGSSIQGQYPILAGQEFYYLYVQLKDFKSKLRDDPVMSPLVANMEKSQMKLLAKFFSEQQWPETTFVATTEQINIGKSAVVAGQCPACHLGTFTGNSRVPKLAGQHPEYLKKTMLDFKNKVRNNAPAVAALFVSSTEEEISGLADYMGGFKEEDLE